ncbi:MAG: metallophosphoesterase [Anaerolineae bacterium]|nr:MAG: metallophosphoesterase [Anaerolineae bacterium]
MKILALSDRVDDRVYSANFRQNYRDVDIVVGCGDLPIYYLEFVADALNGPVLFVRGNHDTQPELTSEGLMRAIPRGCDPIDQRIEEVGGLLLMGLGGSIRYAAGAAQQFSESQMRARIARLIPSLILTRRRHGRFVDVIVAHSPPLGIGDLSDPAHRGFKAFLTLMAWLKPRYFLHGHVEPWLVAGGRETTFRKTRVVNVNPLYRLEISPPNAFE